MITAPLAAQSASEFSTIGRESEANPTVVAPADPNLPQYRVQAGDTRFNGVVRIIQTRTDGTFVCSGSVLNRGGNAIILSAAHCFTNTTGTNITTSVTVEYRDPVTGALVESRTTAGTNISIRSGYTGAVVDQRDVAVINLGAGAFTNSAIRGYDLFGGAGFMGQTVSLAGYGATGNGQTGATGPAQTWMRWGQNRFDTSCRNGSTASTNCAGTGTGNPSTDVNNYGGVIIGDFDDPTNTFNNNASLVCFRFNICEGAVGGTPGEVNIGGGDSGSAAFLSDMAVVGVASFGSRRTDVTPIPPFGSFGTAFGYACVANVSTNAECVGNFNFVSSFLTPTNVIPEPSTYALMATGLAGLFGAARRRKSSK